MSLTAARALVDPELIAFLDQFPLEDLSDTTLEAFRRRSRERAELALRAPGSAIHMETRTAPGPKGASDVRMMVLSPASSGGARPAVVHFHGGGMVMGSPEASLPFLREIVTACDMVVISVDYRLAPEAPYPAGVEDCYAALCWASENAAALGIDPARIGVTGESAGGNLAAAVCLMARDRKGPAIAFQNLVYPMLDDRPSLAEGKNAGAFIWNRRSNRFAWDAYLPFLAGAKDTPSYAAPARAMTFSGLPPVWLSVGALDLFLEQDLLFVRNVAAGGTPVELVVYPGAYHVFDQAPDAAVAKRARAARMEALKRAAGG